MELGKSILFEVRNMNCEFRTLTAIDVNKDYIRGLKEQKKYIERIPTNATIANQKIYINDIYYSKSDTICGLFINDELVGTAGVQLSTSFLKYINIPTNHVATVGIFLFNKNYRKMGIGKTLVWAATHLFHNANQVEWFGAGMAIENIPSLKSFLSCGFKQIYKDLKSCKVLLNYSELKRPSFISKEKIYSIN